MEEQYVRISGDWGEITARVYDNATVRELLGMLPLRMQMGDHLRQEKVAKLPSPLPNGPRQCEFAAGTIGLWGLDHFVMYYRQGRVPAPGIVLLGNAKGNVAALDRPGIVTVCIETTF